ncbi:hypothetical protein NDU88_003744 [Pleurodeles waltl]|uniref:Uncharacterized protein n=1 Tax=Pleurodeles waltl TaxID=8319 RepID=A0AAV7QAJ3_PLEWA|nr:hypothetical protein NDU88_003744 [Pleurodeles waltl]
MAGISHVSVMKVTVSCLQSDLALIRRHHSGSGVVSASTVEVAQVSMRVGSPRLQVTWHWWQLNGPDVEVGGGCKAAVVVVASGIQGSEICGGVPVDIRKARVPGAGHNPGVDRKTGLPLVRLHCGLH